MKDISKNLRFKFFVKTFFLKFILQEILIGANQMSPYAVVFQETNLISDLSANR